jgi:predicted permease
MFYDKEGIYVFLIFAFVALFLFFVCCAWWQGGTLSWRRMTAVAVVLSAVYFGGRGFAMPAMLTSETGQTFRTYKVLASMLTDVLFVAGRFFLENPQKEESREWYRGKGPDEFRNMQPPLESDPMTIKENVRLTATPEHVPPGGSVVLEAFFDPDAKNLGSDILAICTRKGVENSVPMRRVGNRHYRETVTFEESDTGVFEYAVAVPDAWNKMVYVSNKTRIGVAPDVEKQDLIFLKFSNPTLHSSVGLKEVLHLYAHDRKGKTYDITSPAVGTEYRFEDESLATIAEDGIFQAFAPGETVLYATYQSLSTSVEVKISPPSPSLPPTTETPLEDRPAVPTVISPVEGTVVERETKVFFEVTSFDVSKGHKYWRSSWIIADEHGHERAYLRNESEKGTWIPPLSGTYQWRMRYAYEGSPIGIVKDDSYYTPWTILIVVPNSQDVKGK